MVSLGRLAHPNVVPILGMVNQPVPDGGGGFQGEFLKKIVCFRLGLQLHRP